MDQEFQRLQEEYSNVALELQHYKERVMEQEDKIAKLRVEVTKLSNAWREQQNVSQEPVEVPDSKVVTD